MAAAQLRINGLDELRKALLALPADLTREGGVIVELQATEAARQIAAAYPVRRGALRRGVSVETRRDQFSASAMVRSKARHAYIFEHGTKGERRWKTGKSTGVMPAGRVFIPIAVQRRRMLQTALIDLVRRAGFTVTA